MRTLGKADALAEHERQGKSGCTGVNVHSGTASKVNRADAEKLLHAIRDPAAVGKGESFGVEGEVKHPARDRKVHDRRPETGEEHPRTEFCPVGDGTRDERDRNDGEGRLEGREGERREGSPLRSFQQAREAERTGVDADHSVNAHIVREGDRVAVEHPQHADQSDRSEAQHHHADDALGLDEPSVEERETGGHQQYER